MASNDKIFDDSNHYEPLDTLQMKVCSKNGIDATVTGIHIGFMETRFYVHFKMPPQSRSTSDNDSLTAEEEEWLEYMAFLEEDLHWLLKLPHQRFWSQVVYDENLHRCLESYLSQAPRDYDVDNLNFKKELHCSLKKVHRLVFLAYLRMSTYKESKKYHIRPHAFGEIIYDNFIFDIPKILDICGLYGIQNTSIVNKMVQNIFSTQPKYKNDLNETSKVILTAFNTVEEKLQNISSKRCSNSTNENGDMMNELLLYCDLINYITDVSVTMHTFLDNYPPACQIFHQNGYVLRIPTFYEHVFPILEKEIARNKSTGSERIFEDIKRKIILSKTSLLRTFRNIINYTCIQNILDYKMSNSDEKLCASTLVENFLEVIMELVSNRNFLCDYNILYPFETDLELFNELGISVDSERVNYIFCSIHDIGEVSSETFTSTVSNGARPKVKNQIESNHKPAQNIQDLADILKPKQPDDNSCNENSEFIRPSEIEIDSLIQSVLDILPTYGEGFIDKCLEYYSYKSDRVIDAVLTDSLPDCLICLDMNLTREPKNVVSQDSYSVLSERKNVFDNDEFDMFSRNNVNMDNVHIGKKNKTPATYQTLQNDEDSEFLKELTLASGSEETEFDFHRNLYEDEYDDTYDSTMVGLKEPLLEDAPDDDANDDEEEKQNGENSNTRQNSQDFCINPEILRERAEQRRQARGAHNRGRGNRGGSRPADSSDNRQNKDRHKANVGNHNRRKQADFKKSRGMMPFPTR